MSFDDELHYRRKRTTTGQSWLTSSQRKGTWWSCRWRGERTTTNESSYFKGFRFCMLWTDASSILSTHNFTKEEHKTLICTMRGKSQIAMLPNTPDKLDTFGSESSELISFSLVCLCSLQGDSMYREDLMVLNHHIKRSGSRKCFWGSRWPRWQGHHGGFFTRASVGNTLSQELSPRASDFVNMSSTAGLKKRLEG